MTDETIQTTLADDIDRIQISSSEPVENREPTPISVNERDLIRLVVLSLPVSTIHDEGIKLVGSALANVFDRHIDGFRIFIEFGLKHFMVASVPKGDYFAKFYAKLETIYRKESKTLPNTTRKDLVNLVVKHKPDLITPFLVCMRTNENVYRDILTQFAFKLINKLRDQNPNAVDVCVTKERIYNEYQSHMHALNESNGHIIAPVRILNAQFFWMAMRGIQNSINMDFSKRMRLKRHKLKASVKIPLR